MPDDPSPAADSELADMFRSFEARSGVMLAVSGGADSTALMLLASRWRDRGGATPLTVATVDHGLREAAAAECLSVVAAAKGLGLSGRILVWAHDKPRTRIQERARVARYALLCQAAREAGCDTIATAHTLDDQAETVLMRLLRGSGLDGLAGMRSETRRDGIAHLRPLLGIAKSRLVATLRQTAMPWIEDPSNTDPRFERVRIRKLMAALEVESPAAERLDLLAHRLARAGEALDIEADRLFAGAGMKERSTPARSSVFDAAHLAAAPRELRLRVLGRAIAASADEPNEPAIRLERLETLEAVLRDAFAAGSAIRRTLGGTIIALDRAGVIRITPEGARSRGKPPA